MSCRNLRTIINSGPFIALIGDVHAGRKFKTNVPLHRLGEREESIFRDLQEALTPLPTSHDQHFVIMGDLFDKFQVDNNTLLRVSSILQSSLNGYGKAYIHVLKGNHDGSRDLTLVSSFDVLKSLCSGHSRIFFHDDDRPSTVINLNYLRVIALPYSSLRTASEMAEMLPQGNAKEVAYYVLGHWDCTAHGEDTHNVVPIDVFAQKGVTQVYSGHLHKPATYKAQGLRIEFIGSLQPYAHGEQMDDEVLYQTLLKDEVEELLAENTEAFADVNLRVILSAGEAWTEAVPNCLSFQTKVAAFVDDSDLSDLEVGYEEFSTVNILNKNLVGVSEGLTTLIHQRLEHYKSLEN